MSTAMEMLERVIGGEDALEVINCVTEGKDAEGKGEGSSSLRERAERFLRLERRRERE